MPEALPVLLLDQNVRMGVADWLRKAKYDWTVHHLQD
jgi:hypothetical protein